MYVIAGLGNPGENYRNTRHNLGFRVVDQLAGTLGISFSGGKGPYLQARGDYGAKEILLVKPLTFMNLSGQALFNVLERFPVPLSQLLVICDDFNLPLGRIRLRPGGSDGGHRGLASIIYSLGSEDFPRLRLGIDGERVTANHQDFVLSPFKTQEEEAVGSLIDRAAEAVLCFLKEGTQKAMSLYNRPDGIDV